MIDLHALLGSGSYLAIFFLMIANGVVNFPSSQLLYLIVGYLVGIGKLTFLPAVIVGALGNTVGNIIAFMLIRKYERPLARKILMLKEDMFDNIHTALHDTFSRKGIWWLFIGKLTPSVKAFIPVVAGLAHTPVAITSFIFLSASTIWAAGIVYLGKTFGEQVSLSSFLTVSLVVGLIILFVVYRQVAKKISPSN